MSILLLGFLIGLRHALEVDHVAAVATLVTSSKTLKGAVRHGLAWGLGHTLTLFVFGSVVVVMDTAIPERVARGLEFAVGLMLIVLGIDVIRRLLKDRVHFHAHTHRQGIRHFHAHSHAGDVAHDESAHEHTHKARVPWRALLVGLMHGMAGSAALIILALGTVSSLGEALFYMIMFGLGSMIGMAALSAVIALPLRLTGQSLTWLHRVIHIVLALVSCTVGTLLAIKSL